MADYRWYFRSQRKGDRDRNPIQNEFFASEQIGSVVSALIREGMQNSGDARSAQTASTDPVRVRIYVSGDQASLSPERVARWGAGLWTHVSAPDSGLRHPPSPGDACRFLVFEDFGTTGLIGDTRCDDASKEPFYCFFRAENTSSKGADAGGSWGVGKTAFPRASAANAFFALSRREDDGRTILMGSLTLRTRRVDGVKYNPDSWFGVPESGEEEGGVIQPVEDDAVIRAFTADFQVSRTDQPGTSIVVPWCDKSLTAVAITAEVIKSNFIPIITGLIAVEVISGSDDQSYLLNAETIECQLDKLDPGHAEDLRACIRLARWAGGVGRVERVAAVHTPTTGSVKWEQYSLRDADRQRLRGRFDAGQPISVRVPVPMLRKRGIQTPTLSHLDVLLQRVEGRAAVRPVFVRGSVVVPDKKIRRVNGAVAIILAEHDDLGNLLRSAEDPGHKEWSAATDNFKVTQEQFRFPKAYLALARNAAFCVSRLLQEQNAEEDSDLLSDVFALPRQSDEQDRPVGGGRRNRKSRRPPNITVEPKPQIIRVTRLADGFAVTPASREAPIPARIRIRAAYDVRSQNPFKQWEAEDFEFGKPPVRITEADGVTITLNEGNRLVAEVTSRDFRISMTGFNTERGDLIVDARPEGRLSD